MSSLWQIVMAENLLDTLGPSRASVPPARFDADASRAPGWASETSLELGHCVALADVICAEGLVLRYVRTDWKNSSKLCLVRTPGLRS